MTNHDVAAGQRVIPGQREHLATRYPLPLHEPRVYSDGVWATHDYACPVCRSEKAVWNMDTDRFMPCWKCHSVGWVVAQRGTIINDFLKNLLVLVCLVASGLAFAYFGLEWFIK